LEILSDQLDNERPGETFIRIYHYTRYGRPDGLPSTNWHDIRDLVGDLAICDDWADIVVIDDEQQTDFNAADVLYSIAAALDLELMPLTLANIESLYETVLDIVENDL
jgi:hypothetical protein